MAATWSSLRASDGDRERVAERLKAAATEGRLAPEELEDRLAHTLRARTYGELDAVVSDLPSAGAEPFPPEPAWERTGRRRGAHPRTGRSGRSPGVARARARAQTLARQNPVMTVLALVVLTLAVFVIAAIVMAGVFALSGLWIVLGFLMFARGGRGAARVGAHHHHRRF